MNDLYIIKDRLNEALKARDMTPQQLADKSGLYFTTIYRYLNGDRIPKTDSIEKMALALRVSPAWLLGYDVPMSPSETARPDIVLDMNGKTVVLEVKRLTPDRQEKLLSFYNYLLAEQGGAKDADTQV